MADSKLLQQLETKSTGIYDHPTVLGTLRIFATETAILAIQFTNEKPATFKSSKIIEQCVAELDQYFAGQLSSFTVPTEFPFGTPFQVKVWQMLAQIPAGTTMSYQDLAEKINHPKAIRAVGHANRKNPIAVIHPCHRVIGKNGELRGYAGKHWRKQWLLEHEAVMANQRLPLVF